MPAGPTTVGRSTLKVPLVRTATILGFGPLDLGVALFLSRVQTVFEPLWTV